MYSFIIKLAIILSTYFVIARPIVASIESGASQDLATVAFAVSMMILLKTLEEKIKVKMKNKKDLIV